MSQRQGLVPTGQLKPLSDIQFGVAPRAGFDIVDVDSFEDPIWRGPLKYNPTTKMAEKDPHIDTYQELRQKEILEAWPMAQQLEALTEDKESPSRPQKLNALLTKISEIKVKHPKK